ncbi:MAG TPA: rhomboid family intramembrane serine protease [Flavobacterium sp.]|jgi:rhomboid protease GluP
MAFGFPPSYSREFSQQISEKQFLVMAYETVLKASWIISAMSATSLVAKIPDEDKPDSSILTIKFYEGIATVASTSTGNDFFDFGNNSRNVFRFINSFHEVKNTFETDLIDEKYEALQSQFQDEEIIYKGSASPSLSRIVQTIGAFLIPGQQHVATPILVSTNVLIFMLMVLSSRNIFGPDTDLVIQWGGNYRPETIDGQPWRILTSVFLHLGFMHLLINMLTLIFAGWFLEPLIGKCKLLLCYLLAAIGASTLSLWWHAFTVSAGASGAIFGLYGVLFVLLVTNVARSKLRKALLPGISIYIAYNLVTGLQEGVDNAAHIGGLLVGIMSGLAIIPTLNKNESSLFRYVPTILISLFIPVASMAVYLLIATRTVEYSTKMKQFNEMESLALEVYTNPSESTKQELLYELKERSDYYWMENLRLINEIEKMSLGYEINERNKKIKEYCQLHLKLNDLLYKALEKESDEYEGSLYGYNEQIKQLRLELD